MIKSLCCTSETNTRLLINYAPMKINFFNLKKLNICFKNKKIQSKILFDFVPLQKILETYFHHPICKPQFLNLCRL